MKSSKKMKMTVKVDLGASYLTKLAGWFIPFLTFPKPQGMDLIRVISMETGTGSFENVEAVKTGETTMACVGPMSVAEMAVAGKGYFKGAGPDDSLCAMIRVPHPDAVLLAVKEDSSRKSYADIFDPKEFTVVVSTPGNSKFFTSILFERILNFYGNTFDTWSEKGGRLIECLTQEDACSVMMRGQADAIFADNICLAEWWNLDSALPLRYLDIDEELAANLTDYGFVVRYLEPDGKKGLAEKIRVVDASDWVVICKKGYFPEGITHILEHGANNMESFATAFPFNYISYPVREQPIPLPMKQEYLTKTGIVPLHEAAAAVYKKFNII